MLPGRWPGRYLPPPLRHPWLIPQTLQLKRQQRHPGAKSQPGSWERRTRLKAVNFQSTKFKKLLSLATQRPAGEAELVTSVGTTGLGFCPWGRLPA